MTSHDRESVAPLADEFFLMLEEGLYAPEYRAIVYEIANHQPYNSIKQEYPLAGAARRKLCARLLGIKEKDARYKLKLENDDAILVWNTFWDVVSEKASNIFSERFLPLQEKIKSLPSEFGDFLAVGIIQLECISKEEITFEQLFGTEGRKPDALLQQEVTSASAEAYAERFSSVFFKKDGSAASIIKSPTKFDMEIFNRALFGVAALTGTALNAEEVMSSSRVSEIAKMITGFAFDIYRRKIREEVFGWWNPAYEDYEDYEC